MKREIGATFRQATVKNGLAVLQFEVRSDAASLVDIIGLAGTPVTLGVTARWEEADISPAVEGGRRR